MLRSYADITDKLGEPLWWDDNGAPRYCVFGPRECGVYDRHVALVEIECQACGRPFKVAAVWSHDDDIQQALYDRIDPVRQKRERPEPPSAESIGDFHYGDPPQHGCVGDTMNVISRRVLEYWNQQRDVVLKWQRRPEYEIAIEQAWAKEEA